MTEFIDRLGVEFFMSRWRNTCFFYAGDVLSVLRPEADTMLCTQVGNPENIVTVPLEHFSGFGILKYPALGYRRITALPAGVPIVVHISRSQSYSPGIVKAALTRTLSPLSNRIVQVHTTLTKRSLRISPEQAAVAVFHPSADRADKLEELIAGVSGAFIPNSSLLIEPSVREDADGFDIFLRGNLVGTMDGNKRVTASSRKTCTLIEKVLENV